MRRKLNIGLIGMGWMGKLHSLAYRRLTDAYPDLPVDPQLFMLADTSDERLKSSQETLGYQHITKDWREVISHPEIDIVSICTPNFMHAEMGVAAAEAGKAFWIEKPVGRNATETEAVAEAVRRNPVVNAVGFNYRGAPAVEHAREVIASGQIGQVTNVRAVFLAEYSSDPNGALSWRFMREFSGSGVLGDLMVHMADMAAYLVGPIRSVCGTTQTVYQQRPVLPMGQADHFAKITDGQMGPVENEDIATALVNFAAPAGGGPAPVGTLEVSRISVGPRAECAFQIYGTKGAVSWSFERMNELLIAQADKEYRGYTTVYAGPEHGDFARFQPGAGIGMGYDDLKTVELAKLISDYLNQDKPGYQSRSANVFDALAASRVAEAVEISAAKKAWVEL